MNRVSPKGMKAGNVTQINLLLRKLYTFGISHFVYMTRANVLFKTQRSVL